MIIANLNLAGKLMVASAVQEPAVPTVEVVVVTTAGMQTNTPKLVMVARRLWILRNHFSNRIVTQTKNRITLSSKHKMVR